MIFLLYGTHGANDTHGTHEFGKLNSTTLGRTTAVVGQWRNIDNLDNLYTCTVYGTDSGLTAIAGTLHVSLHLAQTQVKSNLGTILSGHLGSIRSVLLRTTEAHLTG